MTGYISYSELSRKKRYNLHKIVNVGKDIIVQVTGFNNNKNFAELSVRALIASDIEKFGKTHRRYTNLYNLWRYVFMKLNPELNMNLDKINSQEINTFMENTFWKIEQSLEDKNNEDNNVDHVDNDNDNNNDNDITNSENNTNYDLEEIYNILTNSHKNNELLKYIDVHDTNKIKNILDDSAHIKTVIVKQSKFKEFNIYSLDCEGLDNIKNSLDFKSYDKWDELMDRYDINILYLTGGKYSLTIKQKNLTDEDINVVYNYIVDEIKSKCELNNVKFTI